MLTPRVPAVARARADFDELEVIVADNDLHWSEGVHVSIRVWQAPDDQMVQWINTGATFGMEDVALIAERLHLHPGAHLFVAASGYADGFDTALDEALTAAVGGEITITLLEDEPVHPEVAAVPMPEPAPAVSVPLTVTEYDFDFLTGSSFQFDFERWRDELETYDPAKTEPMADVDSHWKMAYIMDREGSSYADVMLATAFLKGNGHAYELASAFDEDRQVTEWWLLTDFKNRSWRRAEEQDKVKARLAREAAETAGDELTQAYLMPAAEKNDKEQKSGE